MSEQKPEYVVILDSNAISAGRRINALAAEGYEVVAQSSSSLPGQESGWFTTWTLRLRPQERQVPAATRSLFAQINELDTLARRLEAKLDHSFWTNAEINGMHCRVLVSARTEETGRE